MPRYDYTARNSKGEPIDGVISAATPTDAARLLRTDGKYLVRISELVESVEPAVTRIALSKRVKAEEVIFFASQMAVMVDTGVAITEALEGIIEQTESPAFRGVLEKVYLDVQTGTPLSTALAKHPKAFRPLLISLVQASEASGKLGQMLDRAGAYLGQQRETRKKVTGALIYPAFLMFMSIGVVIFLLTFLMPKFAGIYAGRDQLLPTPTKILLAVSGWISANWIWCVAAIVVIGGGGITFLMSSRGKRPVHWLMLHLPLLGGLFRKTYLTRSLRTLGTLTEAGVAMLDAVGITRNVVGNRHFQAMWDEVDARVQVGEQLSAPLESSWLMPRSITQMIRAGERSGQLALVLNRVCDFLDQDLDRTIKRVTQMIEPIMIVVMGGIVGSIAIALLLPIFTISRVMSH